MSDDSFYWMAPTLVFGTVVGSCYLEKKLSLSGWVVQSDQSWLLVASGWSLLPYCWPIALIFTVAGCLLSEFLQIIFWERTRRRLLQQCLSEETKAKTEARRLARAELEERELLLTRKEREVQQREAELDRERAAWRANDLNMQQQLDNECARANRAESRWRDANGLAQRNKEAKLEARKSNAHGAAERHKRRSLKIDDDVDYSGNPNPRR